MDSTLACLAAWMPRQRWYSAKGRRPHLRFVASWDLPSGSGDILIRTLLVSDEGSLPPILYQVPVVARSTAAVDAAAHVIGSPEPGTTLIDGPTDPSYTAALLELITSGGEGRGVRTVAAGIPAPSAPALGSDHAARVVTGEQSNTSIIYLPAGGEGCPVICKIFRQVHPGLNPDIELQTALAAAGSPHVPRAIGSVEGVWPDVATAAGSVSGSLAFAQEFLPDVEDAWRVALRAGDAGDDFSERAHALGVATAEVHLDLARLFSVQRTQGRDRQAMAERWNRQLSTAIAEVPALAPYRAQIAAAYERARDIAWPPLQRIHGDFHLGQVILVPGRGWVLVDFEGEPLRPMNERIRPDLALRDVAGMLRSFDYVAGSIRLIHPDQAPDSAIAWARSSRAAFLEGYALGTGVDLGPVAPLLNALELDKAVYEAIYESRNRPTWVPIPLGAIARLLRPQVTR